MKKMANGNLKKIGWRAWLLFAIAFGSTLLATAPASLLARVVETNSNGKLLLANADGSIWRGSATPAIRQRAGSLLVLEKLHWKIVLLPLLSGKLAAEFNWDNVMQSEPMLATVSMGQIELRHAVIPLQAAIFGEFLPLLQPAQLSGQVQLRSDKITLSQAGINGTALGEWTHAGSVLSAVNPLGNYSINMAGAGERLDIRLVTSSGTLQLEGSGSFTREQGLQFQATARAAADSKGSIDELLNNLGPETAPGVHALKLMR